MEATDSFRHGTELNTAVKSFMAKAPGAPAASYLKLFIVIILISDGVS